MTQVTAKVFEKHGLWNYTLQVDGAVRNGNVGFTNCDDAEQDALRRARRYKPTRTTIERVVGSVQSTAPRTNRVTLKAARAELKALGMTITKTDGEYRVTFRAMSSQRAEAVAHYTNDLDDAVATGKAMRQHHIDNVAKMPV